MSVVQINPIQRLPWGGSTGVGRPTGIWTGTATAIMDASGGDAQAQLQFQAAGDALQALLYHLGQWFVVFSGQTTARTLTLQTQEMGWGDSTFFSGTFGFSVQLPMVARSGGGSLGVNPRDAFRNALLGVPLRSVDPAILEIVGENIDGDTLSLNAMGYYWDQTTIAQLGAPRLPEGALWS